MMQNIIFKFFLFERSKIPRTSIPRQIKQIDKIIKLSRTKPKNKIEIIVATRGPDPLAIGYTFVKSPI